LWVIYKYTYPCPWLAIRKGKKSLPLSIVKLSYNELSYKFQRSLFLRIPLIPLFIWKHNVYKQIRYSIILERKGAWEAVWGIERVALIKSLFTRDSKRRTWGVVAKFELKMSADIKNKIFGPRLSFYFTNSHPVITNNFVLQRPSVNFINVLRTTFMLLDPKSVKNTVKS